MHIASMLLTTVAYQQIILWDSWSASETAVEYLFLQNEIQ